MNRRLLAFFLSCALMIGVVAVADARPIVGSNKSERLVGTIGVDRISGGGGNDDITGGPGNDILSGGNGNDIIDANAAALAQARGLTDRDAVLCGKGRDTVYYNKGDKISRDCEIRIAAKRPSR